MKYVFNLDEYWNIIDSIHDREDIDTYGFKQIKIAEKDGSELYVYGYRIVVPELNMTVREGLEYCRDSKDEEMPIESTILYNGDEKDPFKFYESYCNVYLPSLIEMIANNNNLNPNPKCYIDDDEFEIWID